MTGPVPHAVPPYQWIARLKCGHEARTRGKPRAGTWILCISPCQSSRLVVSVAPLPEVPAPGAAGVQGVLFELEHLASREAA